MEQRQWRWAIPAIVSTGTFAVAVAWLTWPVTYPYGSQDRVTVGVNHLIEAELAAVLMLVAAALGIVLTVAAAKAVSRAGGQPAWRRVVGVGAAVEAAFFAVVFCDAGILSTLGYAVALCAPFAVAVVVVVLGWRLRSASPVAALATLGVVAVAATAVVVGAEWEAVTAYLGNVSTGMRDFAGRIAWSWGMAAVAAAWAGVAFDALIRTSPTPVGSWTSPESVGRWGRVVTIAAAVCPVPYGLARVTWLTPWPLAGPDELVISGSLDAATRLQGFMFAPACAVGVILTLGLISRWGEVFPGWLPRVGGQPVPIRLAVIPGAIVAGVISLAAPGLVAGSAGDPRELAIRLLLFPLPVWGPMLGAAVLAYWLRRTGRRHGELSRDTEPGDQGTGSTRTRRGRAARPIG